MALYADLRFAAVAARGFVTEHGIAWMLPRLIGEAIAMDLLLTARTFTGTEAAEMGLVNKSFDGEDLMTHVGEAARTLANDVSPRSLAIMKRARSGLQL